MIEVICAAINVVHNSNMANIGGSSPPEAPGHSVHDILQAIIKRQQKEAQERLRPDVVKQTLAKKDARIHELEDTLSANGVDGRLIV